jgi:transposase-like protein
MESLIANITLAELCRKYNLKPNVFSSWKQKFMEGGRRRIS